MGSSDIPMGGDEVWITVLATFFALYFWFQWYWGTNKIWPARWRPAGLPSLWGAPLVAALLIGWVLRTVASYDVVSDPRYLFMYQMVGMCWVGLATRTFAISGLIMRDDAVERRNPAVGPALSGAIVGVAAAYAGGNIGDGPGWWVVVACALFATVALFAVWQLLDAFTKIGDAITIDRDVAAGWRLGGFLLSAGLILGRAVAGDWVSVDATLRDAVIAGWPVLILLGLAIALDQAFKATVEEPTPELVSAGLLPAVVMVGLAGGWLAHLGLPQ